MPLGFSHGVIENLLVFASLRTEKCFLLGGFKQFLGFTSSSLTAIYIVVFIKMSRHPEVLWAQRSEKVYLTVALPDAKNVSVKSEPHGLFSFSATGVGGESFDFSLELYGTILPEGGKMNVGLRNIICSVQKEERGWWKRLLKSDGKPPPYVKVDWNKWCDEDEEELTESDLDYDDDRTEEIGTDESSDDDGMLYLPDLEKARRS